MYYTVVCYNPFSKQYFVIADRISRDDALALSRKLERGSFDTEVLAW